MAAPPPSSPSATFTSLGPGSSGPAVSQLQQNLRNWEKANYGWSDVRVSGTYDNATKNAVQSFQDANPGTSPPDPYGTYGPATAKAISRPSADSRIRAHGQNIRVIASVIAQSRARLRGMSREAAMSITETAFGVRLTPDIEAVTARSGIFPPPARDQHRSAERTEAGATRPRPANGGVQRG